MASQNTLSIVVYILSFTITLILLFGALVAPHWVGAKGWSQGLHKQCIYKQIQMPLPLDLNPENIQDSEFGCDAHQNLGFVSFVLALGIVSLLADLAGTLFISFGTDQSWSAERRKKYLKRGSVFIGIAIGCLFLAIVIFGAQFPIAMKNDVLNGKNCSENAKKRREILVNFKLFGLIDSYFQLLNVIRFRIRILRQLKRPRLLLQQPLRPPKLLKRVQLRQRKQIRKLL